MLDGRAAHQRDLNSLGKWADRNLGRQTTKANTEFLHLGWNDPSQPRQAGAESLGRSSAEKKLEVHVDKFTSISTVCLDHRSPGGFSLGCILVTPGERSDHSLCLALVRPLWDRTSSLVSPAQDRYSHSGVSSASGLRWFRGLKNMMEEERQREMTY